MSLSYRNQSIDLQDKEGHCSLKDLTFPIVMYFSEIFVNFKDCKLTSFWVNFSCFIKPLSLMGQSIQE